MILFPAIDIKDGKVVRLKQGLYDQVTEYSSNPVDMAKYLEDQGAQWLHLVDLNGALEGHVKNLNIILEIAQSIKIPVQIGGGIRKEDDITRLITGGVERVILGTKAIEDAAFLKYVLSQWKNKIAISLDCKNGLLAARGWTEITQIKAIDFIKTLENKGISCIVYTDIARDGMLTGPNIPALLEILNSTKIPVIASGGIGTLDDIKKLVAVKPKVYGAISGKAIYEKKFDFNDALRVCLQNV